jgi:hypothetical protein
LESFFNLVYGLGQDKQLSGSILGKLTFIPSPCIKDVPLVAGDRSDEERRDATVVTVYFV